MSSHLLERIEAAENSLCDDLLPLIRELLQSFVDDKNVNEQIKTDAQSLERFACQRQLLDKFFDALLRLDEDIRSVIVEHLPAGGIPAYNKLRLEHERERFTALLAAAEARAQ